MPATLTKPISQIFERSRQRNWWQLVDEVFQRQAELESLDDGEIRRASQSLRYRAKSGEPLDSLVSEGFAIVREAGFRRLGFRHYKVQVYAGLAMHHGCVAEMQTGEGKTLTATLPLYIAALSGRGVHLATANDYLAQRDAETMTGLFDLLGISVGVVTAQTHRVERSSAYRRDITYGTAKEFGFDFLRDRLRLRDDADAVDLDGFDWMSKSQSATEKTAQRRFNFALIDEADSILIDEARTPLVVSALPQGTGSESEAAWEWAAEAAREFEPNRDFEWGPNLRTASLNSAGRRRTRSLEQPNSLDGTGLIELYDCLEKSIVALHRFHCNQHYIIRDEEVVIVDENTGRLAEGRKWRGGIHQAIEAKEGLPVSNETGQAGRITIQSLMRRYDRLAGMTGTTHRSTDEFQRIYGMGVVRVPTHLPERREALESRVLPTAKRKWDAIVEEINAVIAVGRPVLVGTRTIEQSKELSDHLAQAEIQHRVLNATQLANEATIVAEAGKQARVTVSTNMAGRGTDIGLDESVRDAGGLHVICSEIHESQRIDRQLIGRCGRQGDPGSFRIYYSLEDEILEQGFGLDIAQRIRDRNRRVDDLDALERVFRRAQKRIERRHFRDRAMLLRQEQERAQLHEQLGQDPFLDSPV